MAGQRGKLLKRSQRAKHKVEEAESAVGELEAELESLQRANSDLANRNSILEKYLKLKEGPPQAADEWWLDSKTRAFIEQAFGASQTITFTVCESRPLTLTCAEIASMTSEQYWMLFKMFADAFQGCIIACKGEYVRGTPLATRLERLCFESGALRCIVAISHPSRIFRHHIGAAGSASVAEATEVWQDVLKAVQLTDNQRQQMLELRRRFLRRVSVVLQERHDISAKLLAIYPHGDFNHQSAFQYLQTTQATEELQENLQAELCGLIQFHTILWKNCLNSLQAAIVFTKCTPYFMEAFTMAELIAREDGAPSLEDIVGRKLVREEVEAEDLITIRVAEAKLDCHLTNPK